MSHQAVYDVLRALTAAGLVRRIQPTGSVARYEARVGDNHHHVVCRDCGAIADVDCAVGDTPCLTAAEDHGFAIDEAEVVYWGLCPACSTPSLTDTEGSPVSEQHNAEVGDMNKEGAAGCPVAADGRIAPPHRGRRQPRLVAQPAQPEDPAQAPGRRQPMGADFDYAAAFNSRRPRRAGRATSTR